MRDFSLEKSSYRQRIRCPGYEGHQRCAETEHRWRANFRAQKPIHPHSWNAATSKTENALHSLVVLSFDFLFPIAWRGLGVSYGGASPGTAYPPRQLDVLLHDGDPFGVDGAQVDVLEEVDEEGLGGFLQGLDRL